MKRFTHKQHFPAGRSISSPHKGLLAKFFFMACLLALLAPPINTFAQSEASVPDTVYRWMGPEHSSSSSSKFTYTTNWNSLKIHQHGSPTSTNAWEYEENGVKKYDRWPGENGIAVFEKDFYSNIKIPSNTTILCKRIEIQIKSGVSPKRGVQLKFQIGNGGNENTDTNAKFFVQEGLALTSSTETDFNSSVDIVMWGHSHIKMKTLSQNGFPIADEIRNRGNNHTIELTPSAEDSPLIIPRVTGSGEGGPGKLFKLKILPTEPDVEIQFHGTTTLLGEFETNSNANLNLEDKELIIQNDWTGELGPNNQGTIKISGDKDPQTIGPELNLDDLVIEKPTGSTVKFENDVTVNGTLDTSGNDGTIDDDGDHINAEGDWVGNSSDKVKLLGDNDQNLDLSNSLTMLHIDKGAGTVTVSQDATTSNLYTKGDFSFSGNTVEVTGDWTGETTNITGNGKVKITGSGTHQINPEVDIDNLEIATSGTVNMVNTVTVNGSLDIQTATLNLSGQSLNVSGNIQGLESSINSGKLSLTGASDQIIEQTINHQGDFDIIKTGGTVTVDGLQRVYGTFTTGENTNLRLNQKINLQGDWTGPSGTITASDESAEVRFGGATGPVSVDSKHTVPYVFVNKPNTSITFQDDFTVSKMLTLSSGAVNTNGKLVLQWNEDGNAMIPQTSFVNSDDGNNKTINGDIKVERHIAKYDDEGSLIDQTPDWHHIGPLIGGMTLSDWNDKIGVILDSDTYHGSVATFQENTYGDFASNPANDGSTSTPYWHREESLGINLTPGLGYNIYTLAPSITDGSISFEETGAINLGNVSVTLNEPSGDNSNYGFYYLSNPYPCPISWTELYYSQSTALQGQLSKICYVWDTYLNSYRVLHAAGSSEESAIPGGIVADHVMLAPGQAFFIKLNHETTSAQTFNFTEESKVDYPVHDVPQYRKAPQPLAFEGIILTIEAPAHGKSPIGFKFDDKASPDFDISEDIIQFGEAYLSSHNTERLETGEKNNVSTRFNVMPFPEKGSQLDLSFAARNYGTHTIKISEFRNLKESRKLTLHDNFLDKDIDLTTADKYSFEVTKNKASYASNRFAVKLGNKHIMNPVNVTGPKKLFAGKGRKVTVPVSAEGFKHMKDLTVSLGWDPAILSVERVKTELEGDFSYTQPESGKLNINWASSDENGISLPENGILFNLEFIVADETDAYTTGINIMNASGKGFTLVDRILTEAPVTWGNSSLTILPLVGIKATALQTDGTLAGNVAWNWKIEDKKQDQVTNSGTLSASALQGEKLSIEPEINEDGSKKPSVLDLLLIRRHILGVSRLYKALDRYIADANDDYRVSTADISSVRSEILGLEGIQSPWRVIPEDEMEKIEDEDFADIRNDFETVLPSTGVDVKFLIARKGDLTSDGKSYRTATNPVKVELSETRKLENGNLELTLSLNSEKQLDGVQFTIDWDDNTAQLDNVSALMPGQFQSAESTGSLSVIWNESGEARAEDLKFVTLVFSPQKGKKLTGLNLEISSSRTEALAATSDMEQIAIAETSLNTNTEQHTEGLLVGPNPFSDKLSFTFNAHKGETATFNIFNADGQLVESFEKTISEEKETINWNVNQVGTKLTAGIYIYRVTVGGETYNGKVVRKY
ncbi:hypothetical protein FUAX_21420 [Fulvitalea axinellae]|uniref:Secretion system C-terminal sorting domain-containing protein n=2 Tax=Fulvitalea axinellae TaxID=1182444 RepID=A0AAU9CK87_9BACT|nr:hypothetical protein FUAX_21420 [Fulvitalea axinellae]